MKSRTLYYVIGVLVLLILGSIFLRFELPVVSVSAEKIPGLPITNALLTAVVVSIIIIVAVYFGTRNMQLVPSGLQNVLEIIVEALYNQTESVSGPKWAPKFFIIPSTIFIYVLVSNWIGLFPGLAGIGICEAHHHEEAHVEEVSHQAPHEETTGFRLNLNTCDEGEVIVPLFRSPSADLNNTLMLAVLTQVTAQVFGVMALGAGGYLSKFFVFDGLTAAFKPDAEGNRRSFGGMLAQLALGFIDLFVGLLEFMSEFVKVIAFTFRLFGNIFAGEVMLIVLTFLVPLILTLPFLGLEVFVGLVQAFVFYILSIAFYTVAVIPHGHEEAH
jgi:F-type H+-transporting ATPase subunit a